MTSQADLEKLRLGYVKYQQLTQSVILVGRFDRRFYQYFTLPSGFKPGSPLPCSILCKHGLKRFHFSCFSCRIRKVMLGRMPRFFPVERYQLFIWPGRKHRRFKAWILKWLLTLAEYFAV